MTGRYLAVPSEQRTEAQKRLERGERLCDAKRCGHSWSPSRCFHCNREKPPASDPCPHCARPNPLDLCPKCQGEDWHEWTLEEALGFEPTGRTCSSCPWVSPESGEGSEVSSCPLCGAETDPRYPDMPDLTEGLPRELLPDLLLIYAAEGRIAKDEGGLPVDTSLESWLTRHGVEEPEELDLWEDWIHAVAGGHRQGTAERMEREQAEREAQK